MVGVTYVSGCDFVMNIWYLDRIDLKCFLLGAKTSIYGDHWSTKLNPTYCFLLLIDLYTSEYKNIIAATGI